MRGATLAVEAALLCMPRWPELFKTKQSSDATFAAVKNVVGERGVVDLIVSAGYYQAVSMFMNTDRLPVNATQQPELKYLAKPLP